MTARRSLPIILAVALTSAVCPTVAIALALPWRFKRPSADLTPQFYTDTREHQSAACPLNAIVVVTFGQSLAANSHQHIYNKAPNQDVYQYFSGHCSYLADPVMGATGRAGSFWVPAASRLAEAD